MMLTITSVCKAEVWVVTSVESDLSHLSMEQCKRLWLGELEAIDGKRVFVVDQFTTAQERTEFYTLVADMNQNKLRSYWAKKIFSSGLFPPDSKPDDATVIEWIKQENNRIGYINSDSYRPDLKVLYVIKKVTKSDEK